MNYPTAHIEVEELNRYIANEADREQADRIKKHVASCDLCQDRLIEGFRSRVAALQAMQDGGACADKRADRRFPCSGTGYLQALCPLSLERVSVELLESSKGGIGLLTESALERGTLVQVCAGTDMALGEVASCVGRTDGRYRVGIRLQRSARMAADWRMGLPRREAPRPSPADGCDLIVG